jgi:predicted SAM-dependent methyltransferase
MKVHLGSGTNVLSGWINLDMITHPGVKYHDLRNPLPFNNSSIDFFFSEHFFEHLTKNEGLKLLGEIHRCLVPGGISRITVPDLDVLVKCYVEDNITYYGGCGGGWQPKTKCDMMNEGMREWGHQYMYNIDELLNVHSLVGFYSATIVPHRESTHSELHNVEVRGWTSEICIEAKK